MGAKAGIGPIPSDLFLLLSAIAGGLWWDLDGMIYGTCAGFFFMVWWRMK
jgi:hypothetical protein